MICFCTAHPNKDQYNQYLHQWQTYEKQMEEKKTDIHRRKEEAKKNMKEHEKAAAKGQPFPGPPPPGMMGMGPPRPRFPRGPFGGPPPPGTGFHGHPGIGRGPPMGPHGPRPPFGGPGIPVGGGPGSVTSGSRAPRGPPGPNNQGPTPSTPSELSNQGPVPSTPIDSEGPGEMGIGRGQFMGGTGRGRGSMNDLGQESNSDKSFGHKQKEDKMELEDGIADVSEKTMEILFEELMNSDNVKVNKAMLKQINNDGRTMLTKLELAAKVFVNAFAAMNPAQLNRMVKVINDIGDESVMLKKMGGVTPAILNRMKNEVLDEMKRFGIAIPDIGPIGRGRPMQMGNNETDIGMGRAGPQRGGMPFSNGRGRGSFQGNRFGGPEQSDICEDEKSVSNRDGNEDSRFGNDRANKPSGSDKRGPVSLFDLDFSEPPGLKKSGLEKSSQEKNKPGQLNDEELDTHDNEEPLKFGQR